MVFHLFSQSACFLENKGKESVVTREVYISLELEAVLNHPPITTLKALKEAEM